MLQFMRRKESDTTEQLNWIELSLTTEFDSIHSFTRVTNTLDGIPPISRCAVFIFGNGNCFIMSPLWSSPGGSVVENPPVNAGDMVWSLGWEDPLEEEMAAHSSILAWRGPRRETPSGPHRPWGHKEPDTAEPALVHQPRWCLRASSPAASAQFLSISSVLFSAFLVLGFAL